MKVFFSRNCEHLKELTSLPVGNLEIHNFPDGELDITLHDTIIPNEEIWLVANTFPVDQSYVELLLLLDLFSGTEGIINVFIPYFGYARQDRAIPHQPFSARILLSILQRFDLKTVWMFHIHQPRLSRYLLFNDLIWIDFFTHAGQGADIICAPDFGVFGVAQLVANACKIPLCSFEKKRTGEHIDLQFNASNIKNKRVLIVDDMISTGTTVLKSAQILLEQGAKEVSVAATHGIFAGNAKQQFEASDIKKVYVTNSLDQSHKKKMSKIVQVNCMEMIDLIMGQSQQKR